MIDLAPFCYKSNDRPYLLQPWTRGGFTWATNGHILVRVPAHADVPDNKYAPNCERIIAYHDGATFAAFPAVKWPDPPDDECSHCEGRGYKHNCPDCSCKCDECEGTGYAKLTGSVTVRGVLYNTKYIRMIQALLNAEFAQKPAKEQPAPFRFDGGIGCVMPMRSEGKHHIGDIEKLASSG